MDYHDQMAEKLLTQKSLAALIWLINHGRELEFTVNDTLCFITMDTNGKGNVALWIDKTVQYFEDVEHLIENAVIQKDSFFHAWKNAEITTLF